MTYYKIELQMHDPHIVKGDNLADGLRKLADEIEKSEKDELEILNTRSLITISTYSEKGE